jgi:hypothetical protein
MTHREQSFAVLLALFDLSRAGLPCSPARVAGRIGMCLADVDAALCRLATSGLVSGTRLSLTGLAIAASLDATRATITSSLAA